MCTSLTTYSFAAQVRLQPHYVHTPYPFAAQVRLQPHRVYIPLPTSILLLSLKPIDSKPSTQRRSVPVRRYIMDGTYTMGSGATMHILASGHSGMLFRACVDCGLITGCFCEYCLAAQRMPEETWAPNQCTPLCTKCEAKNHGICHFCRGVAWVVQFPPHVGK